MAACCLKSNTSGVENRDGQRFVTISKGAVRPVLALLTLPGLFAVTSFAQINSSYFGLAISGNAGVVWPSAATQPLQVGAVRAWDSGTRWDQIETAKGVYSWTTLDAFIAQAQAQGQEVLYTFGGVPSFISSNPGDTSCGEGSGSCDPPLGLYWDGSGTDAQFQAFVTALMLRYGNKISQFEAWNEANNTQFWNGTAPQIVRMASDARTIIKRYNSAAQVLTPSTCACLNTSFTGSTYNTSNPQDGMNYYLAITANTPGYPTGASLADGVAIHTYVGANPPENILKYITGTQSAMTENGVGSLPLIITEASWGPNTLIAGCSSSAPFNQQCLDTSAAFLARSLVFAASNEVSQYYWYAWGNTTHGTLYNTSTQTLFEPGNAYAVVQQWLVDATFTGACSSSGTVWTCQVSWPDGFLGLLVWDTSQNCTSGCTTSKYTIPRGYVTQYDLAGDPAVAVSGTTKIGIKPVLLANARTTGPAPITSQVNVQSVGGPVNLTRAYNLSGIVRDGSTFTSGGIDGVGDAYSANLLGASVNFEGLTFTLGPANAPDAVTGTTIPLPAGEYSTLTMLATAVNATQEWQTFVVNYTDGTTASYVQSLSAWGVPQNYPGESLAVPMSYRDTRKGTENYREANLYEYSFFLNIDKTVSSITLPNNGNVVVLAITLIP
jgi:hypothetical protein